MAASSLAVSPLVARAETVAGVTDGALSVDKLGAAVYSVPIAVPPGVAGMQPSLSVNFRSRDDNGIMGLGWSIGGLSVIHRCPQTPIQDGARGGVDFDAGDRFCLDGQRLIAVSGDYGADGTEYRTEIDSFARITSNGTAGTGPLSFTVEARSGWITEYGATADSRVEVQGAATVRLWAASRVEDRLGNYMTLHYQKGAAEESYRVERIEYAGNDGAATVPQSEVRFLYEARPDPQTSYQSGTRIDLVDRLSGIEAWTDGGLVREYRFAYDASPFTDRSRLRSITECAANGDCLAPLQFDWTQSGSLSFTRDRNPIYRRDIRGGDGLYFGDWNGDGITDVMWNGNLSESEWYVNDGAFNFTRRSNPVLTGSRRLYFGDWNADGISDFMFYNGRSGEGDTEWLVNDGDLGFTRTTNPISNTLIEDDNGLNFGDWNGDGILDAMWHDPDTGRNHWFVNDGNLGFTETLNPIAEASLTGGSDLHVGDWNGDGIADVMWYDNASGTNRWFVNDGALGFAQANDLMAPASVTGGSGLYFGDWNGDGVLDVMWYDDASGSNHWFVNDGALGLARSDNVIAPTSIDGAGTGLYFGDWNSDGITDTLWYSRSSGSNHWYVGDGALGFTRTTDPISRFRLDDAEALYFGDWTGEGITSLLWYNTGGGNEWHANQIGLDQLVGVTDSLGRRTGITYAPLTDETIYTKGTGATLPEVDLADAIYVVEEISTDDGIGGQARLTYAYEGLRGHIQGRGSLGFSRISSTNQLTGITNTTDYLQDFPFIGLAAASETRLADGTLLSRASNAWQRRDINGGLTTFPFVEQSLAEAFEVNDGPGNSPVVTTTADIEVDDFGNPTLTTAVTTGAGPSGSNETFRRIGRNSYSNDTFNWLIGQLRRAEVESELPDFSSETRVTAFDYFATTGLLQQEVIEPDRAGIALTTDYAYDGFGNLTDVTVSGPDIASRGTAVGFSADGRFATSVTNALGHGETRAFDARFGTVTSLTG
ncbi:MAG: FG-GAP-like repeat-containing protein, partial [Kiloniellales bacterium]|nr:FG-GAP-like repeat-containing protein [Kiloniellales bacterium]